MPTLLTARNLSKAYPAKHLFEGVSMHIADGERIGLIGPNGSGKSTLMKMLAGALLPDAGEIIKARSVRAAYVGQDDRFPSDATPLSVVTDGLEGGMEPGSDASTRASIALSRVGFTDLGQDVATLSGGWRKRLSLASAIAREPDVLLLDEPTNHLDLEGVLWLEGFVNQAAMAVVFVTHDRRFLENTATRIIELSSSYDGGSFECSGNYTEFVKRKAAYLEAQRAAQTSIASKVRRDTAWLQQGIQGRQTRNKTQVQAAADRREELKATAERNAASARTTSIAFQATERQTKKLLVLKGVSKAMGPRRLFESLDATLTPGQRVGLMGANGSGKTTLMRLIAGDIAPDAGTVERADNLRIVTFSQHRESLDQNLSLHQALCPIGDTIHYRGKSQHVAGWAARFLFNPDQLPTRIKDLSGGEQARVQIANLMLSPADVLLLDEPTNDLDIPSLEILEQSLMDFPGALVLVTHDRFLLERVATEYLALDDRGHARWFASMEQWRAAVVGAQQSPEQRPAAPDASQKKRSQNRPAKLSYKLQLELDGMEDAILHAEDRVAELEAAVADPAFAADHARAGRLYTDLTEAQAQVTRLYERWGELEALREGKQPDA